MSQLSLSPSAASRWLTCKASPGFIAKNADKLPKESSVWAEEGVKVHEIAAASILMGMDNSLFEGQAPYVKESIELWHNYVRAHIKSPNDTILVEKKLPLFYMPRRNGITDVAVVNRDADGRAIGLFVADFKNGEGVTVDCVGNPQPVIYARNILSMLDETLSGHLPVKLAIVQPRAREGGAVKEWELTVDELRDEADKVEAVAREILLEDTTLPFAPSDKACQFCPAQALCPAYAKAALADIPTEIPLLELPSVDSLTLAQLGKIQASAPVLKKFLEAVHEHLLALGTEGKLPPETGFKLVAGRSIRAWTDEAEAQRLLVKAVRDANKDLPLDDARDQVAPRKVMSPSQAEKLLKPIKDHLSARLLNSIERLSVKPDGSPTIAPLSDKRPALAPLAEFANLNHEDHAKDLL